MPEYFKFCPKCGRVLNRDWCTYCEPEKEEAYRKEQLKRYRIQGDYVSDTGIDHDIHGGIGGLLGRIGDIFQRESVHEKSVNSGEFVDSVLREQKKADKKLKKMEHEPRQRVSRQKTRNQKKPRRLRAGLIVMIIGILWGILPLLLTLFLTVVEEQNIKLPQEIVHMIERAEEILDDDNDQTTIYKEGFDDVRNIIDRDEYEEHMEVEDYALPFDMEYDGDDWEKDGESFSAYMEYAQFVETNTGINTYKGAAKLLDLEQRLAKKKVDAYAGNKQAVDYSFEQYLTYFDDGYSCVVLEERESDHGSTYKSYLIDNTSLDLVDLNTKIDVNDYRSDIINDAIDYMDEEEANKVMDQRKWIFVVDKDGEIHVGLPYSGNICNVALGINIADIN